MKSLRRYLCVLLCCVSLLVGSSVSVSAEELDIGEYQIRESVSIEFANGSSSHVSTFSYIPGNGNKETSQPMIYIERANYWDATLLRWYEIFSTSEKVLAYAGKETTVRLDNIYYSQLITDGDISVYDYTIEGVSIWVNYVNGTRELLRNGTFDGSTSDFAKNLKVTFTPSRDVKSIQIIPYGNLNAELQSFNDYTSQELIFYMGEWLGDGKTSLVIVQPSEEESLLGGILDGIMSGFSSLGQKLGDVWNSITDGFAQMGQKLTDLWNAIINLPAKIWEFIENGLKELFIPDDDFMLEYKDRVDELLSTKLGAVYEVVNVTFGAWEQVGEADETNIIHIPVVSIPLPDNNEFSFGGYDVEIVPTGFEFIVEVLKLAVGIACTILFINGLRTRYDEVMGVEK